MVALMSGMLDTGPAAYVSAGGWFQHGTVLTTAFGSKFSGLVG